MRAVDDVESVRESALLGFRERIEQKHCGSEGRAAIVV